MRMRLDAKPSTFDTTFGHFGSSDDGEAGPTIESWNSRLNGPNREWKHIEGQAN